MAGLWQQLSPALAVVHLLCLLCPHAGAHSGDVAVSPSPLQGFMLVRRNFSLTFHRVGYHKVAEIPAAARNIKIQETVKSRNYLALQTQTGVSIINGNWLIDRPGIFTAVGTQLTYRRPNEIRSRVGESIAAPGPLAEALHVYLIYQQPGPSVIYEYSVPLQNSQSAAEPDVPSDILPLAVSSSSSVFVCCQRTAHTIKAFSCACGLNAYVLVLSSVNTAYDECRAKVHQSNDIIGERPHSSQVYSDPYADPQPAYSWKKSGHTECSTTCGTGRHQLLWTCVDKDSQVTVPTDLCESAHKPVNLVEDCSSQPCPAYWDIGEWSDCSRRCGPGTQHRQVICRQVTHVYVNGTETSVTVEPGLCGSSDRPVTESNCQLKICSEWKIRSEWSPCSVPCGVGQRSREVACVSNQGDVEEDEECNMHLKPDSLHNCDMGACARSWFTSLWSHRCSAECGRGNRTRTAVCLMDHVSNLPLDICEGERPSEVTVCDSGPCQNRLEWYTGPWSQCSAECGNGTQTRSVACLFASGGRMEVVEQGKCSSLPQPVSTHACSLKPCGVQWYVTEWSTCSRSCSGGYRVREVRCLTDNMVSSDQCDPSLTPESREECNKQPCVAEIDPSCSDQYHNCLVVIQARLCIYSYYRSICCSSCSKTPKSYPNHIRR